VKKFLYCQILISMTDKMRLENENDNNLFTNDWAAL